MAAAGLSKKTAYLGIYFLQLLYGKNANFVLTEPFLRPSVVFCYLLTFYSLVGISASWVGLKSIPGLIIKSTVAFQDGHFNLVIKSSFGL